MLTAQVDDYKDRLANAVEGLSPYDVKVLRAEKTMSTYMMFVSPMEFL